MRNRIVRLLAVGVSAALIFSFAACGNKGSDGDTTSGTNTEAVAVLEPVEPVSAAETESVPETETETPTQAETESKLDGGSSDGGKNDPQSGAGSDSGSGQQGSGGSGTSGGNREPEPEPTPKPDFDPDTVIEMVHQKVKANPDLMWFYDHPNVPPDAPCDMGWIEEPYIESSKTMEEIAQDLYEGCLSEYKWGGCNWFFIEYLGTNSEGNYRFKLYRGTLT